MSPRSSSRLAALWWMLALLSLGVIATVGWLWFVSGDYTDGLSIVQKRGGASPRIVLWEKPEALPQLLEGLDDHIEPVISSDRKMMVFAKGRAKENAELYMSRWQGRTWGTAEPMTQLNTRFDELGPELSADGNTLYFYSDREGGKGGYDLWASFYNGNSWDAAVNLGASVNSPFNEYDPSLSPGGDVLYFSSNRPRGADEELPPDAWKGTLRELVHTQDYDIFTAGMLGPDEQPAAQAGAPPRRIPHFRPAARHPHLNSSADEGQVDWTPRGDFVYFSSNRGGGHGGFDLYRSRLLHGTFLNPENLGSPVNSVRDDMDPALWLEGHSLVFSSNRDTAEREDFIIYQSTSREVIIRRGLDTGLWWAMLKANWLNLLLALLALLILLYFMQYFWDPEKRDALSLMNRCLLASCLFHVFLLFLFSLKQLASQIYETAKGPSMEVEIDPAALARERLALNIREQVSELPDAEVKVPVIQQVQAMNMPAFEPVEAAADVKINQPAPSAFKIELTPSEHAVRTPVAVQPEPGRELPEFTVAAVNVKLEIEPRKADEGPEENIEVDPDVEVSRKETPAAKKEAVDFRSDPLLKSVQAEVDLAPKLPDDARAVITELPDFAMESEPLPDAAMTTTNLLLEIAKREAQTGPEQQVNADKGLAVNKAEAENPQAEGPVDLENPVTVAEAKSRQVLENTARLVDAVAESPLPPIQTEPAKTPGQPSIEEVDLALDTGPDRKPEPTPNEAVVTSSGDLASRSTLDEAPNLPPEFTPEIDLAGLPKIDPAVNRPLPLLDAMPSILETRGAAPQISLSTPEYEVGADIELEYIDMKNLLYTLRDPEKRKTVLKELGGTDETEAAIKRSLEWFTRNQEADGHWDVGRHGGEDNHDMASTGFALLCYMGWGASHTKPGAYQGPVKRGLDYLLKHMKAGGDLRGSGDMYDHGIAAIALTEAYGLTRDETIKSQAQSAVDFIVKAQHQGAGGWRYKPGEHPDTSVVGWQIMALRSAEMGGLNVPRPVIEKAEGWLKTVGGGKHGGLYGYQDKNPKPAMVAEGMFCRQLMGYPRSMPAMGESANYLKTQMPTIRRPDYYYWYYGCLALYQHKGPVWEEWNKLMRTILLFEQKKAGDAAGSWDPKGVHAPRMGRVCSTAMATLCLEVYYRYLPLYGSMPE